MANDGKFLNVTTGVPTQETGATAGGAGDANKIPKLDGAGKLAAGMLPTGVGPDTITATTSEALAAGDLVNFHVSTGTKVRKADATTAGKEAQGYVLAAFGAAAVATVYLEGTITGLAGLTAGARQFLATTAGARTETPPSATGQTAQMIGWAVSATELSFEPQVPILLA